MAEAEPAPPDLADEPEPSLEAAMPESEPAASAGTANPLIEPLAAAEQQPAERAVANALSLPGPSATADNDDDSAAGRLDAPAMPEEHAPGIPLNGTAPKPRSGRGSRRTQPPAEPTATDPPKRRSSRSKRKQTT
jgi:hypothetical protein